LSDEEVMSHLGLAGVAPEGRFFPDTYMVGKGTSDLKLLQRAAQAMQRQLSLAWETRDMGLPLKSADEALILASIIEKETGLVSDRPMISSVFINRLRINMPLQTDPTVIYGLFEQFDGNLRRVDLQTDHPWNTYTRRGLPPTPIAMPGKGALHAALHPATSQALYFVARGDGSSQFSNTLDDHNAAVNRYQRGQTAKAQEAACNLVCSSVSKASTARASPATSRLWHKRSKRQDVRWCTPASPAAHPWPKNCARWCCTTPWTRCAKPSWCLLPDATT